MEPTGIPTVNRYLVARKTKKYNGIEYIERRELEREIRELRISMVYQMRRESGYIYGG